MDTSSSPPSPAPATPTIPMFTLEEIKKARPWVDEDRIYEDPLPPVTEYDDRPAVRDLVEQHWDQIQLVREGLQDDPLYNEIRHDDLFILRFFLSQKKVEKAISAAKATLLYRQKRLLDEKDIREDFPGPSCSNEAVRKYFDCTEEGSFLFSLPHPDRGVVAFIKYAGFDQHKLVSTVTLEEWPFWYFSEWAFQTLDSITRRTGRLTKSIRFIDLDGFQMWHSNREKVNRDAISAKELEDNYPQLLSSLYLINSPSWFETAFSVVRPILPQRFVAKFDVINPSNETHVPRLLKHLAEEHIPERYGGKCTLWPYPSRIVT